MKNLLSIFLAGVVLCGHMGLTFLTHYCCGISVKHVLSIGQSNLDCGMAGMDDHTGTCQIEHRAEFNKVCCEDQHQSMDVDDVYQISEHAPIPAVAYASCTVYKDPLALSTRTNGALSPKYHPPPPDRDILLFQQTFRL